MPSPSPAQHERGEAPLPPWLAVVALRALATSIAVATGFSAVSDDDFARIVIAQGFAHSPSLDPSGTSWLPFPFWLTGTAMSLFGPHVWVARALSWLTSLGSSALVYLAARYVGFRPAPAALGAALAAVLPHAVWLGVATVPEGYSAALCLFAIASHVGFDTRRRWFGALAVTCAALSRYEAWPVALLLAGLGAFDAQKERNLGLLGPALCSLAGPVSWLLHGVVNHDDALFFLKRVADYRRALGRSPEDFATGLLGYPKVLLRGEPELTALFVVTLVSTRARAALEGSGRLFLGAGVVLAFLVLGDLGDGAPTHHPERPLLLLWLVACVLLGQALVHALVDKRWRTLLGLGVLTALVVRPIVTRRDGFIDRSPELAIGALSRDPVGAARLAVDADDYAFFAVMAGFERVHQCEPLRQHDPRAKVPNPWATPGALRKRLWELGAGYLIAGRAKVPELGEPAEILVQTEGYVLVRLGAAARPRPEAP